MGCLLSIISIPNSFRYGFESISHEPPNLGEESTFLRLISILLSSIIGKFSCISCSTIHSNDSIEPQRKILVKNFLMGNFYISGSMMLICDPGKWVRLISFSFPRAHSGTIESFAVLTLVRVKQ